MDKKYFQKRYKHNKQVKLNINMLYDAKENRQNIN